MIIGDLLDRNARRYPKKTAVFFRETRYTFGELKNRVCRLSNAFWEMGIRKGDRVALLLENCHQYLELYLAVTSKGAIAVPLNYRQAGRELTYIINDAQVKAVVSCKAYLPVLNAIEKDLQGVKYYISIDGGEKVLDYEQLITAASAAEKAPVTVSDSDVAYLMYTSGTTGYPKGVILTHKNIIMTSMNLSWSYHYIEPDDVTINFAPLFHSGQASISMCHFYSGATNIIMEKFNPQSILETIQKEKVTNFWAAPTMINMLIKYPEFARYDLSSLRQIAYSGAPMPVPLLKECLALIGPKFIQMYGLTEAGPHLTSLAQEDHVAEGPPEKVRRLGSVGKEVLNTQVRVVNERGEDVAPGEVGEIIGKGDNIMQGYWNLPKATAEALRDGWLYTGDLATVDEDGYIYIVDCKKDMIISGGENIYPKELENVIYEHPAVLEAAVIGLPDTHWGELVMALIVLKQGQQVTEEEIIEYCKKNLASYKKPKRVKFIDELPKNPSGKVLKTVLRQKFGEKKPI
ncbi:long-chain-fatty-acid--CoA ligase [Desulfoscipio gibsoniae]|uniref:Acyl-CoA synthetase (AMP-forming)/AMP-acid ligase II n=1 Tax=Desulfoscipio gibsoniae DSM 7213 TaxID=767817 RepID=R4KA72_9FIRM|nr:long-chain-fatty-acid--CoA ligase [Desulfoscipio gibsoniae]AGL00063.1 acyl-CoA synthetase (AMP-forming)/AMP-acid ligase II [Desulfoscipio gibsoniae DSM 7213]